MQFLICALLGFLAELIDGTAGMAYGVSSNTFLRSVGIPSAVSSACVHISEMFTTLVSGLSHWRMKNVNWKLFLCCCFRAYWGGVLGAYLLVNFESRVLDILIDVYLIIMGAVILSKAFQTLKRSGNSAAMPMCWAWWAGSVTPWGAAAGGRW